MLTEVEFGWIYGVISRKSLVAFLTRIQDIVLHVKHTVRGCFVKKIITGSFWKMENLQRPPHLKKHLFPGSPWCSAAASRTFAESRAARF